MDLLEYIVRIRGAAAAAAEVRGVAGAFKDLAKAELEADASGKGVGRGAGKSTAAMTALKGAAAGTVLALVGVGFEAVKMSTAFNHEMLRIRTDAGASTQELANMKNGVLDLASSGASMGQGPMSLAQGLYHLESLGIRGSRALFALKLASQESAISGANLEQTTSALGAAMYVGIKGTGDLTHLMGILNATVGAGNMRFQDLVDALGMGVLSSAEIAGLGIQDVSAALAVLTDSGMQASSGAAQLATALHFLYAPTSKAKTALADIGIGANQLGQDMHKPQGLLVALTDLRNHLEKLPGGMKGVQAAQTLSAILPGGRGRVLLTELTMLDRLKGKYEQINKIAGGFAPAVQAQKQNPETQLKTAEARVQASMIRLGNVLGPIILPVISKLMHAGSDVLNFFTREIPKLAKNPAWRTLTSAISTIARVLGTIASKALPGLRMAFHGAFTFISGIVETVAGILTGHFGRAFNGIKKIVSGGVRFIVGLVRTIAAPFIWIGTQIRNAVTSAFNDVIKFLGSVPGKIGKLASTIWGALKSGLVDVINWIIGALNGLINTFNNTVGSLPLIGGQLRIGNITPIGGTAITNVASGIGSVGAANAAQNAIPPIIPGAARGGNVWKSGLVRVGEKGEEVVHLPAGASVHPLNGGRGGGWPMRDLIIQVGKHQFARVTRKQIIDAMAANA